MRFTTWNTLQYSRNVLRRLFNELFNFQQMNSTTHKIESLFCLDAVYVLGNICFYKEQNQKAHNRKEICNIIQYAFFYIVLWFSYSKDLTKSFF